MSRIILQPGYRNNNWEFVRDDGQRSKRSSGYAVAVFRCLLCNTEFVRGIHYIEKGKTKSCRQCSRKQFEKPFERKSLRTKARFGWDNLTDDERHQMHLLYKEQYATFSYRAGILLSSAKRSAKKLNLSYDLSKDWLLPKLESGSCEITGVVFDMNTDGNGYRKFGPSLDRQNPKEGYTKENVKVVVWMYNLWKSNYEHSEVVEFAKLVAKT